MSVNRIAVSQRWNRSQRRRRRRTLQIGTQEATVAVTQKVIQMMAELLEVSTKLVAQ